MNVESEKLENRKQLLPVALEAARTATSEIVNFEEGMRGSVRQGEGVVGRRGKIM